MSYRSTVRGESFRFPTLASVLARANEEKSGDQLAGVAAGSARERVAAKLVLADLTLAELVDTPVVEDAVTDALLADQDTDAFATIADLTVGEFRELVLTPQFPALWNAGLARAVTPEIAAAVAKLMSDLDLMVAARPLRVVTRCRASLGQAGVFGCRLQPNSPTDDPRGIVASTLDGLLFGCGDAMIGVNPADERVDTTAAVLHVLHELIARTGAPTQACVLAHLSVQIAALEAGAPVDLLFQSVAGTAAALASFGVDLEMLRAGRERVLASHAERPDDFPGPHQVMYCETGQGSALSADAHRGVGGEAIDQLTLEARAQGVARLLDPFLVNSVVGFIGPEYLADSRQITRAGLEDHFVGKLMGLPIGVDVCYTNHVDADQSTNDDLLVLLASAGCSFVMGLPAGDDVMLGYQSTSYHDVASVRRLLGLRPGPEFEAWLADVGITTGGQLTAPAGALGGVVPGGAISSPAVFAPVLAELTG